MGCPASWCFWSKVSICPCFLLSTLIFYVCFRMIWWSPAVMKRSPACRMREKPCLTWKIWGTWWSAAREQRWPLGYTSLYNAPLSLASDEDDWFLPYLLRTTAARTLSPSQLNGCLFQHFIVWRRGAPSTSAWCNRVEWGAQVLSLKEQWQMGRQTPDPRQARSGSLCRSADAHLGVLWGSSHSRKAGKNEKAETFSGSCVEPRV